MKDLTTKGLGGASGISKLFGIGQTVKPAKTGKMGNISMIGYYNGEESKISGLPPSDFTLSASVVAKYSFNPIEKFNLNEQLVISDKDYIPDNEYADLEG